MKAARYMEWWRALRAAHGTRPWWRLAWGMVRAMLSGGVSRAEWRRRMRICSRCPIYRHGTRTCGPKAGWAWGYESVGCGCYVPFKARTALPYRGAERAGCWGRAAGVVDGWGSGAETALDVDLVVVGGVAGEKADAKAEGGHESGHAEEK